MPDYSLDNIKNSPLESPVYIPLYLIILFLSLRYALHVQPFTFHDVWLSPLFHTLETAPQKQHYHQHYQECTTCSQAQIVIVIIHHRFPWFLCFSFTFHYVWLFPEIYTIYSCSSYLFTFHYVWLFLIQIVLWLCLILIYIPLCLIISEILSRTIVGTYSFTFHYVWLLLSA